jgi:hypothetical protein
MRIAGLLCILASPGAGASLFSSVSLANCGEVSAIGTASAHLIQYCQRGDGTIYDSGHANATSAFGVLTAESNIHSQASGRGSAHAEFLAPLVVNSPVPSWAWLEFAVEFTGFVANNPDSSAVARSTWTIGGLPYSAGQTPLGSLVQPPVFSPEFKRIVHWSALLPVALGSYSGPPAPAILSLGATLDVASSDYFGYGKASVRLLEVTARDQLGNPIPLTATFAPEPETSVLLGTGLGCLIAVCARRRKPRSNKSEVRQSTDA